MKKQIIVLSPHLDDAALSCFDHITLWRSNYSVTVFTIFSSFESKCVADYSNSIINKLNVSVNEYELLRKKEDEEFFNKIGLKQYMLNFVDGGFRFHKQSPLYKTPADLFSGKIVYQDHQIKNKLKIILSRVDKYAERVVIPAAIGSHADHIIVKEAAEETIQSEKITYFCDYPYALNMQMQLQSSHEAKHIEMSQRKRDLLNCYESQMPLLFPEGLPHFCEITFSKKST